ncbi:MAG: T9SS type A sorting domain-containing protein [Bacteroidia bacterium]
MKKVIFIYFFFCFSSLFSQTTDNNLWQEYLPYVTVNYVAKKGDLIYGATPYAILLYDNSDNSKTRISKVTGLNDFGIAAMALNEATGKIIVGYNNGNIDFIDGDDVIGQPAIKVSPLLGDKGIYDIYCEGEKAYISTGFGIVVLDAVSTEVTDTYIIGDNGDPLKINAVSTDNLYIYAATDKGLKKADKTNQFLANSALWQRDIDLPNVDKPQKNVTNYKDFLFVVYSPSPSGADTIYYFDGVIWNTFNQVLGYNVNSITQNGEYLVVSASNNVFVFNEALNLVKTYSQSNQISDAFLDSEQTLWMGDAFDQGILKYDKDGKLNVIKTNGVYSNDSYSISEASLGKFWVTGGGVVGPVANPLYKSSGFSFFDGLEWKSYNRVFNKELNFSASFDYLYISANPKNIKHVIVSSYHGGLIEYKDSSITLYDESNSTLYKHPSMNRYNLTGVAFDKSENIWVSNSYSPLQLSSRTIDGIWTAYNFGTELFSHRFSEIFIDSRNYKWMVSPSGGGVVVFDDNKTPTDLSDDKHRILTTLAGNGGLPSEQVWCVTEDLDGLIWIGTSVGPAVFFNPENIFDTNSDIDAKQIFIEQDGNVEILLGAERVTAIEIDGANRKWIGTENSGIFVFNEDTYEQVHHFTRENSPLFSNNIFDIRIDKDLGYVYTATANGLLSYKNDATNSSKDFSDAYVYPNPIRENYTGEIFFNGLMRNTDLKVTDTEGNLVIDLKSLGGQATWDGNDMFGNRIKPGIYMAFLSNPDGSKTKVIKFLVAR